MVCAWVKPYKQFLFNLTHPIINLQQEPLSNNDKAPHTNVSNFQWVNINQSQLTYNTRILNPIASSQSQPIIFPKPDLQHWAQLYKGQIKQPNG